jgi:hypothetical protein
MDLRGRFGRRDAELRRKIDGRAAAEAVAAAGKSLVVRMLMERLCCSAMVRMLFRARPAVSGIQMKRGMGVPADESQRQQRDKTAQ